MGIEHVKMTAMHMYKYKELRLCKCWPCEVLFSTHVNHVSASPTNGNGPTQGQRKTLTRVGIGFSVLEWAHCH